MAADDNLEILKISEELDNLALHILTVMQIIILERRYLDDNLKDGFINMAKSRYLMNGRKVSILQVKTADLAATKKVISSLDLVDEIQFNSFEIWDSDKSRNNILDDNSEGTVVNRLNTLNMSKSEDDLNNICTEDSSSSKVSFTTKNPLHWFGVLVPETLKVCQNRFGQAIDTSVKIASLQNKLKALSEEYKTLRKRKTELTSSTVS